MSHKMTDSEEGGFCPTCEKPIQDDAPDGICPACVFLGVAEANEERTANSTRFDPPGLEEVQAAFPQLEVIELIGSGGMGAVFRARHSKLQREVALKILPSALAGDPDFVERFTREGRVLAKLTHPNIVSVYDFGTSNGGEFSFLLMEYVDGVNLRQAMRAGRFTPGEALAIIPRICEALQYAHDQGVLHRDIKPENLLIGDEGNVKIVDFGIAKLVDKSGLGTDPILTRTGVAMPGTPQYMAPEQIEKPAAVDHRADIFSLGVVFYEMLTGELPLGRFGAPSAKSAVNDRVDAIVMRTLEKEKELRQQSADELRTDILNMPESKSCLATDLTDHVLRSRSREAFTWFLIGLLFLLVWSRATTVVQEEAVRIQSITARIASTGVIAEQLRDTSSDGDATELSHVMRKERQLYDDLRESMKQRRIGFMWFGTLPVGAVMFVVGIVLGWKQLCHYRSSGRKFGYRWALFPAVLPIVLIGAVVIAGLMIWIFQPAPDWIERAILVLTLLGIAFLAIRWIRRVKTWVKHPPGEITPYTFTQPFRPWPRRIAWVTTIVLILITFAEYGRKRFLEPAVVTRTRSEVEASAQASNQIHMTSQFIEESSTAREGLSVKFPDDGMLPLEMDEMVIGSKELPIVRTVIVPSSDRAVVKPLEEVNFGSRSTDPSKFWYRGYLLLEEAVSLDEQVRPLDALNKYNEAFLMFSTLSTGYPLFNREIVADQVAQLKRRITELRTQLGKTGVAPVAAVQPPTPLKKEGAIQTEPKAPEQDEEVAGNSEFDAPLVDERSAVPEDLWYRAFLQMKKGESFLQEGELEKAIDELVLAHSLLNTLAEQNPKYQTEIVEHRRKEVRNKLTALRERVELGAESTETIKVLEPSRKITEEMNRKIIEAQLGDSPEKRPRNVEKTSPRKTE